MSCKLQATLRCWIIDDTEWLRLCVSIIFTICKWGCGHSLPWINMAMLCDCFKLNARRFEISPVRYLLQGMQGKILLAIGKYATRDREDI